MYSKYKSRRFIRSILMGHPYNLSDRQASLIFYDSLNFFFADNAVKKSAWRNIYADRLDDLALMAIAKDDYATAKKCTEAAAKIRGVYEQESQEIPEEMKQKPVIIYDTNPKRIGIPEASRKQIARFIDQLEDISEADRTKLKRESGIMDKKLFDDEKAG